MDSQLSNSIMCAVVGKTDNTADKKRIKHVSDDERRLLALHRAGLLSSGLL